MKNRESSVQFLTSPEGRINQAKRQYQTLLDHYQIWPEAQEAAWRGVEKRFRENPEAMIREIDDYWEEEFGHEGKNKGAPASLDPADQSNKFDIDPETGLSKAESVIYKNQSEHWKDDQRIQRAGSKKKAGL